MTKIDIFSGFLGAGKTTLIKKLIKESFAGQKVVLIENEFGEIGIDGGFLKESGIQINELNAGCICCSLVGDFRAALQQVVEQYHPDRIVIEPSGVGKLSDVTRAVEGVAEHLDVQLNSFVTVADVNKVKMYMKNFGEFYDDQISHASCIILSRTQTASEEKIAAAVAMLREKNPTATIVTTAWDALTGEQILNAMSTKDDFKAELIAMAAKANEEHALTELDSGKYGMILRSKGIVDGGADGWLEFDYVPGEWEVRSRGADVGGKLVVIGSKLDEKAIAGLFGC